MFRGDANHLLGPDTDLARVLMLSLMMGFFILKNCKCYESYMRRSLANKYEKKKKNEIKWSLCLSV